MMDPRNLLNLLTTTEKLKSVTRHCYTSTGRHESVAEHSWMAAMMALLLRDEVPDADMDKVIKMCLLHDMGEAFTGDVPAFHKHEVHEQQEAMLLDGWVTSLPEPYCSEFRQLYAEMDALQTLEAKQLLVTDGTNGRFVTSDPVVLDRIRAERLNALVAECLARFAAYGIDPAEAAALLYKTEERNDS